MGVSLRPQLWGRLRPCGIDCRGSGCICAEPLTTHGVSCVRLSQGLIGRGWTRSTGGKVTQCAVGKGRAMTFTKRPQQNTITEGHTSMDTFLKDVIHVIDKTKPYGMYVVLFD